MIYVCVCVCARARANVMVVHARRMYMRQSDELEGCTLITCTCTLHLG